MTNTTTSPRLSLPLQARPVNRTGMRTAALGAAGVGADGILQLFTDPIGWAEQALTDVVDYVTAHPVETVTNPLGTAWHLVTGY